MLNQKRLETLNKLYLVLELHINLKANSSLVSGSQTYYSQGHLKMLNIQYVRYS